MRRRRRGRNPDDALVEVNLTPMLDVVLQLITFFMMLVHFGTKLEGATQGIRLPVAPAALPGGNPGMDRLAVAIDARGTLRAGRESLRGPAADAWWAEQARARREGQHALGGPAEELSTLVIVRADRDAPYGAVRKALATAQARGFAHFSLIVLRERRP
jgi:biopolymer transport protein ExbD